MTLKSTYTYQELSRGLKDKDLGILNGLYQDFYPMVHQLVLHNSGKASDAKQVFGEIMSILYGMANQDQLNLECSQAAFVYELAKQIWALKMQKSGEKLQIPTDTENFSETLKGIEHVLAAYHQSVIIRNIYKDLEHKDQKYIEWFFGFSPPPLDVNDDKPAFESTMLKSYYLFNEKIKEDWVFIFKNKSSQTQSIPGDLLQIYQYFNEAHPGFSGQDVRERAILDGEFGQMLDLNQSIRNALMLDLPGFTSIVQDILGNSKGRLGFGFSKKGKTFTPTSRMLPTPETPSRNTQEVPVEDSDFQEAFPHPNRRPLSANVISSIVIGVIAILLGSVIALLPTKSKNINSDSLFKANFTLYPEVYASGTDNISPNIKQSMKLYREENFSKAIPSLMASMTETSPDTITVLAFYQGVSYLADGQTSKSIEILTPVAESGHPSLSIPAYWYMGLSFLKMKQYSSAMAAFEKVARSNGKHTIFQKKALRLIEALSR